jgi:cytochrome P450
MMHFFFSDDVRRNPFPWYQEVRAASPVCCDPATNVWMLFDYASVKRAMDDHATFSSRVTHPGGRAPEWLVFLDPPRHSRLRSVVMRAFTPRTIAALEPRIREISRSLLTPLIHGETVDFVADYATPLPTMVIADLIGIPMADQARFAQWSQVIVNLSYAIAGGAAAALAIQAHAVVRAEMMSYVAHLAADRRLAPREDLMTTLATVVVDGARLTDEEILGFFQLLLSAATETTTNLIDNAVICLSDHPDQQARLRVAPQLVPAAIEEVVRFRSPAQVVFRQTMSAVELHGQTIPADRFVLAMVGSANRDPSHFANAEQFDVARDPNPHIAFGHGIHFCLGAALARTEARVALSDLFELTSDITLASSEPWEPRQALHVHGPTRLPVRLYR